MKGSNGKFALSIVIVNWNTRDLLRQCLHSIYKTTHNLAFEIYVVDNNSTDGSVNMIKKEFFKVNLIENRRNEGFATANNQAISRSRGKYTLLLNSDTIVLGNALSKMTEFMDAHELVGVLGCKLLDKDGNLQRSAAWFSCLWTLILGGDVLPVTLSCVLGLKRFPGQCYLNDREHDKLQDVDWVSGACFMVRKTVVNDVGLLDENLFMYGEEIEWCYRIKKAGWSVAYFPGARISHIGGGSTLTGDSLPVYRSAFARRYIYHKHHNVLSSFLYDLLAATMALVKLVLWSILALILPNKDSLRKRSTYYLGVLNSIFNSNCMTQHKVKN